MKRNSNYNYSLKTYLFYREPDRSTQPPVMYVTPNLHYRVHKSPQLDTVFRHINSLPILMRSFP
jgi:hypothetical protein